MDGNRETLITLQDDSTWTLLNDAFGWVRDIAATGLRSAADVTNDWTQELGNLDLNATGTLQDYLQGQDNWLATLFAELLSLVELINPLTIGQQIAIWILEDFRDILRALALLIDTDDNNSDEVQSALVDLGMSAAALCIPYVGRAGKVIHRMLPKFANTRLFISALDTTSGAAMLRYISEGNVITYLKRLDFPSYAKTVQAFIMQIFDKIAASIPGQVHSITRTIKGWASYIGSRLAGIMQKIQSWVTLAIQKMQKAIYFAGTNATNPAVLDKIPDKLLDWVHHQINGNMAESCVDNYFINYMGYSRLYPNPAQRDRSVFFGPDQGIDGFYETVTPSPTYPYNILPAHYNGIPYGLGLIMDELDIEIPGETIAKSIVTQQIKPFGNVTTSFNPRKPARLPRFVVMEAKFGYHVKAQQTLTDEEWRGRLGTTKKSGAQMSSPWIRHSLNEHVFNTFSSTDTEDAVSTVGYSRWLYGCQPVNAENNKKARARGGKRMQGLAFFPPYMLKGFDMDALRWNSQ